MGTWRTSILPVTALVMRAVRIVTTVVSQGLAPWKIIERRQKP
ncbi:MAG: hypothetical protein ACFKPT_27625 [Gloeotrichia echinulata GP01]